MFNKDIYVVSVGYPNVRDIRIEQYFDADIFDLETILSGYKKQLKGLKIQVSRNNDDGFIDVINNHGTIDRTYGIIKVKGFVAKPKA